MSANSDFSSWIGGRWETVRGTIRSVGWKHHVQPDDLDDFTSRVIVRALAVKPHESDGERMNLLKTIARKQALDDARRRYARAETQPFDEWDPARSDPYAEIEMLDQVRRLGQRDGKAILGHALGLYDRELADDGLTLHSVSKRRERARERMAA